jgi:phosphoenolpyruvate carboxylase
MTLPFDKIANTGGLLPLFHELCEAGYATSKNPIKIVAYFFERYVREVTLKERNAILFKFIQYIEWQAVLFDAIKDAAFAQVNNLDSRARCPVPKKSHNHLIRGRSLRCT